MREIKNSPSHSQFIVNQSFLIKMNIFRKKEKANLLVCIIITILSITHLRFAVAKEEVQHVCIDDEDYYFDFSYSAGTQIKKTCAWISDRQKRVEEFCLIKTVQRACPMTCQTCSDELPDDHNVESFLLASFNSSDKNDDDDGVSDDDDGVSSKYSSSPSFMFSFY